jgi:aminoglycoside phosphotransferase (APT) family kinase protein
VRAGSSIPTLLPSARPRRVGRLAREVLAIHAESLADHARSAAVSECVITSTGLAVVAIAPRGEAPCAVVKLALSESARAALSRESGALAALRADGRLGGWRRLLPVPRAHGIIGGRPYRLDLALRGRPAELRGGDARQHRRAVAVAAETIDFLHTATRTTVAVDAELREAWIERHLRALGGRSRRGGTLEEPLRRLGGELHRTLGECTLPASWIHGDYWLGNLLFSTSRAAPGAVGGIVDWETAADLELTCHDLLHLLLYTRRVSSGRELGEIVREQLQSGQWTADERVLLDRHAGWRRDGSLSDRTALLLYWLRHAAMHARQQGSSPGYRYAIWERRNVLPVLVAL